MELWEQPDLEVAGKAQHRALISAEFLGGKYKTQAQLEIFLSSRGGQRGDCEGDANLRHRRHSMDWGLGHGFVFN